MKIAFAEVNEKVKSIAGIAQLKQLKLLKDDYKKFQTAQRRGKSDVAEHKCIYDGVESGRKRFSKYMSHPYWKSEAPIFQTKPNKPSIFLRLRRETTVW